MKRLALVAFLLLAQSAHALAAPPPSLWAKVETADGPVKLNLEIVHTPKARETGLMHRTSMGAVDGMIFLFPKPGTTPFWMKNTKMPLDIIFVSAEKRITYIGHNTTPNSLVPVGNGVPYQTTIEIAGGRAQREHIKVGNVVEFTIPENIHVQ